MYVYIVLDGYTFSPIGVFEDEKLARESGKKVTKDHFMIVKRELNKECSYEYTSMYRCDRIINQYFLS